MTHSGKSENDVTLDTVDIVRVGFLELSELLDTACSPLSPPTSSPHRTVLTQFCLYVGH